MAIFNDYDGSGKFIGQRDEPLTAKNIDRYIEEHGIEKALGYLEAIKDFNTQLFEVLGHAVGGIPTRSTHKIKRDTIILYRHLEIFLNQVKSPKVLNNKNKPEHP